MALNELKGIRFFDATETKVYFNCAFRFSYDECLIYDIYFCVIPIFSILLNFLEKESIISFEI